MEMNCDDNGLCAPKELDQEQPAQPLRDDIRIIYIGDPMCSWCWGISNHLAEIRKQYKEQSIGFEIIVGGLRPGGGDPWDDDMKRFLMHHWKEVNARSGQPFGYQLFDREEFHYDTEPACRAVVTAKQFMDQEGVLRFFEAVQRKFYVDNEDPKEVTYYESICTELGIAFKDFEASFDTIETRQRTRSEFELNRQWGVRGYPTVVLQVDGKLYLVCNGYATAEVMGQRIDQLLSEAGKRLPTIPQSEG